MENNFTTASTVSISESGLIWQRLSQLQQASWALIIFTTCVAVLLPAVITGVYRLYFHPLRNVPGPKLAALTNFYAFYWNWIRDEGYSRRFSALHKYYNSPIIRIGPNSVHTNQPDDFDVIFKVGSKWKKDNSFYKYFNGLDAMIDPAQYRTYRSHLAPLYAQRAVNDLAPKLHKDLLSSAAKMEKSMKTSEAVNMVKVLRTLSTSMILHNLYSHDISLIEYDGYHPFLEAFEQLMTQSWLWFIPGTSFAKFNSSYTTFMKYCKGWNDEDMRIQRLTENQELRDSHMKRYLAMNSNDWAKDNVVPNPLNDIFNFVAGGSDTTSYTLACAFFYILSSPEIYAKLVKELDENVAFIRDTFDYNKIQNLSYLNAVIKETLRISVPVPGCLPRIVPESGTTLGSVYLPAGTAVSISQQSISFHETIFPSPEKFIPERWLGNEAQRLDKWNVAFSRGPRQCIGTSLAYLELRCVLAYFLSRFEMALTGNCGDRLRWVDRFVAVNLDDVEVKLLRDRWN
ncbi:putative elymoclavine monooxygenase [Metarhizium acridum CQMa 102]|uniref:Putative elymoclavine monooxygenase n=1 Tax=Metarhizium acridum (strain CQMa 102) TaxID=655827 RepID=E9EAT5_METAQ|nr:putative elymoclavine monooxygenase [Metarhizium acridum CQMa 102]EFY86969.1 putative elymoclavine monooxygenase [Metarhizium acridum CQMa 102]